MLPWSRNAQFGVVYSHSFSLSPTTEQVAVSPPGTHGGLTRLISEVIKVPGAGTLSLRGQGAIRYPSSPYSGCCVQEPFCGFAMGILPCERAATVRRYFSMLRMQRIWGHKVKIRDVLFLLVPSRGCRKTRELVQIHTLIAKPVGTHACINYTPFGYIFNGRSYR